MKKINVCGYDFARRLSDDFKSRCLVEKLPVEDKNNPSDAILKLVYAPDERTGLPTGDLTYLVSDKANPQVKEFIKTQLLMDTSAARNVSAKYNLSDDDILALTRNADESIENYAMRLNQSIERDKWLINQANVPVESSSSSVSAK